MGVEIKKNDLYTEAERNPLSSGRGSAMMYWFFQNTSAKMDVKLSRFSGPFLIAFELLACGQKEFQGREGPGGDVAAVYRLCFNIQARKYSIQWLMFLLRNSRVRSEYSR